MNYSDGIYTKTLDEIESEKVRARFERVRPIAWFSLLISLMVVGSFNGFV